MASERSKSYEWKIVITLAILWGIVGLDRLVIVYLFPIIIPLFKLNNTQAGAITSILALTWAIAAWGLGNVSDRVGRKNILVVTTIFFSLMSWISGVVKTYASLFIVRGLMGIGEGGVFSSSVATITAESTPERKGLNTGIHLSFFPLLGIGLGAIITTQLTRFFEWNYVFFIVGIPGLIIAFILMFMMKEPLKRYKEAKIAAAKDKPKSGIFEALKYRNVRVSCLIGCLFMTWLFVFSAFAVLFLTKNRGISLADAGLIMSGWGIGGFIGNIIVPAISDYWGRKPSVVFATTMSGAAVLGFLYLGDSMALSFFWLFLSGFFGFGISPIFLALSNSEAVPSHLVGSAVGIPTAAGEIFGAVLMPVIAGGIADAYGLNYAVLLAGVVPLIGGLLGLLYRETAPRVLAKRAEKAKKYVSSSI
jgi:predicted MFS family arabinose efflux permease